MKKIVIIIYTHTRVVSTFNFNLLKLTHHWIKNNESKWIHQSIRLTDKLHEDTKPSTLKFSENQQNKALFDDF